MIKKVFYLHNILKYVHKLHFNLMEEEQFLLCKSSYIQYIVAAWILHCWFSKEHLFHVVIGTAGQDRTGQDHQLTFKCSGRISHLK